MNDTRTARPPESKQGASVAGSLCSVPVAGLLALVLPGLGHWYLQQRRRAVVLFMTITATFWTGVAVGGVKSTVHATNNGAWFAAQLCAGTQALGAWAAGTRLSRMYPDDQTGMPRTKEAVAHTAFWPSDNISVVYAGIAGLLNLLVLIDALARAEAANNAHLQRPPPPGAHG